mmetsp:Transcript_80403/g.227742  ORF Transcript_80403/g.227742 Transcript_80403/m.227742 type:complete len:203 (+) Transcript_80403:118-726(+)
MVSRCDSTCRRSFGMVLLSFTSACARVRKTPSLPDSGRSTRRRQMSRSVKSKGPKLGQFTTLQMIDLWTLLGWAMAASCQAKHTSHMRSIALGSLLRRSSLVRWASLRARKTRWHCSMRAAALPGRRSASLRTSFRAISTPRQVISRSFASFTTASTTPLHSPKRSGSASSFHFLNSVSRRTRSPNSMADWSGGSSRMACLM